MKSSLWSKVKWLIQKALIYKKKQYPLTVLGARLLLASITVGPVASIIFKITLPENFFLSDLEITANEASVASIVLSFVVAACGVFLIRMEMKSTARHTARVLVTGLPGASNSFPDNILSSSEKRLAREQVELSTPESDKNADFAFQIERYNSELCVDLFKRFILHDDCRKIYIGGLARIPFLVSYGAFLRNITAQVVYFDKFHRDGNWSLLDEESCDVGFEEFELVTKANKSGDLGVAIGFSAPIRHDQLPDLLKEHTTILRPNTAIDRNLVKNQENLKLISGAVRNTIDELSRQPTCKRIHLFLSVQSTLAIELGRRFQEGTQCNWVIHNFNFEKKQYDWAIELSKSGIKEFRFVD